MLAQKNLRLCPVTYHVGQTVFKRNFIQSRIVDHYNSKLTNPFEKTVVVVLATMNIKIQQAER